METDWVKRNFGVKGQIVEWSLEGVTIDFGTAVWFFKTRELEGFNDNTSTARNLKLVRS